MVWFTETVIWVVDIAVFNLLCPVSPNMAEQYAYGQTTVNDCKCPALEAGVVPIGNVERVVELYDSLVEEETNQRVGTVSQETAKEKWTEAVQHYRTEAEKKHDTFDAAVYRAIADAGKDVSEEIF